MLGGFTEAERVGIIDYIMSDGYKQIWESYADGEWRDTFWTLWTLKQKYGGRSCASALPNEVLALDIWELKS